MSEQYQPTKHREEYLELFDTFGSYPAALFDRYQFGLVPTSQRGLLRNTRGLGERLARDQYINSPGPWENHPDYSVIIPVELMSESVSDVVHTINLLKQQSEDGAGVGEVLLWVNSEPKWEMVAEGLDSRGQITPTLNSIRAHYDYYKEYLEHIRAACEAIPENIVRIRSSFDFLHPREGLNEIRAKSTLSVAMDAFRRDIPPSLPVGWIDADTVHMQRHAIRDRLRVLRSGQAHFAQGELVFKNGDRGISGTPSARASLVHSVARRMLERNLGPTDPRRYPNECGMFFTLRAYLLSGGVGVFDAEVGEGRSLMGRAEQAHEALGLDAELIHYLGHAAIFTSDRRWLRLLSSLPADQLPDLEFGSDYSVFRKIENGELLLREGPITEAELHRMTKEYEARQRDITRAESNNFEGVGYAPGQNARLDRLIARCAFR